ncbi:MAG: two-component regulator propeller domain-containing protein, partial [Bacteroidota bacterium]
VRRYVFPERPRDGYGPSAYGLHMDPTGTLWFGHLGGLYRRSPSGEFRVRASEGAIERIQTVPGGAWVGTAEGLHRYDEAEDAFQPFQHDPSDPLSISDDATLAIHMDARDRLWVGTQSGLNRYDPDLGGFIHFDARDGLPSNVIYAILEDDDGRLWISTNRGLARYDETAAEPFRAYTEADGVGNVEFNRHAAWRDADGTMYFGGDRGVTVFHPDDLAAPAQQSPIVVTAVRRSTREGTETTPYPGTGSITLAPEVTTFAFEFAALDFTQAHLSRYAVRLDGWDEDWVEIGDRREVAYTNLPPGPYTFRVRTASADGAWGAEATAVAVLIRPAWWQTAWFRLLAVLVSVGLVAGVGWDVSRRRYRRELAALRAKQALDAERARISRDMHDEVGASLSEIAILSELAQLSAQSTAGGDGAPTPPTGRLRQIAETSRETLDSIAEIVWALNPTNDRLPTLSAYLREHAARYAESTGLRATLRFPAHPPDRPVSAEVRRAVFLILKEALHNVVKHAGATGVDMSLLLPDDSADSARLGTEAEGLGALVLIVADDGAGLAEEVGGDGAPARIRGGNGLHNMRQRAEEIGGTLVVEPGVTGGTVVRLSVPLGETIAR